MYFRDQVSISSTFFARFFRTNVVFLRTRNEHVTRKKAAETTFVRKIHTFNVDEIVTWVGIHKTSYANFKIFYNFGP